MEREVMWISLDNKKFEHVMLTRNRKGVFADGIMIHLNSDSSYRIRYKIVCDELWKVREVEINFLDRSNKNLILHSDGKGSWIDFDKKRIKDLTGCTDVDLYYSPFTNTLSILKLNLDPGESKEINTAFIQLPELSVFPDPQRYTCLEKSLAGGKYVYENMESGFKAELSVDSDGLLLEYTGFFKRHWSR